jgi:uncharacterized membrane protein YeaQ/YmgE (transglycosylase-associated protein family)
MFEGQSLIIILLIGLIAGFLAGKIMKGSGFGIVGDIILGVIGAFVGAWLWGLLRLPTFEPMWLTRIVAATIGAVVVLFIIGLIRRH